MADASAAEWLERVLDEERRGELLAAVDLAEQGLGRHPTDLALQHRLVLALARAGATEEAAARMKAYALDAVRDEEVAALGARIAKDRALALSGAACREAAAHAAGRYGEIYDRTGGYYPGINAATMYLVAGDNERARVMAGTLLRKLRRSDDASYYAVASEAEACLVLGDVEAAAAAVARAAQRHQRDLGALATSRRQMRMVCELQGIDPAVLDPLAGPSVAHYCGHVIAPAGEPGRFLARAEAAVAERVVQELGSRPVGFAYGALAAGADILWAEALLSTGAELHVVLPFNLEQFVGASVAPAGEAWVGRFHACLARAKSVSYGTRDAFRGDDALFRYGSELAMGLAVLRARYLDADVRQLAVWDGEPAAGNAGTAIDVERWRATDRPTTIISPHPADGPKLGPPGAPVSRSPSHVSDPGRRVVRAMLFADVKGFSKLSDEQLPRFADQVLGGFARVLDRHGAAVEHRNTWGDALYAVVADVPRAAACALELQEAMRAIDLDRAGLPRDLAMRLGAHVGPVFPIRDPVLDVPAFMGSHVSRTARIEPVTPAGEVYVTEPFAAALALHRLSAFMHDYVGHLPAAKDFGRMRMYRLHRTAANRSDVADAIGLRTQ